MKRKQLGRFARSLARSEEEKWSPLARAPPPVSSRRFRGKRWRKNDCPRMPTEWGQREIKGEGEIERLGLGAWEMKSYARDLFIFHFTLLSVLGSW